MARGGIQRVPRRLGIEALAEHDAAYQARVTNCTEGGASRDGLQSALIGDRVALDYERN